LFLLFDSILLALCLV